MLVPAKVCCPVSLFFSISVAEVLLEIRSLTAHVQGNGKGNCSILMLVVGEVGVGLAKEWQVMVEDMEQEKHVRCILPGFPVTL